jgi:hypothetical protein
MTHRRLNGLFAILIFMAAFFTYLTTMAPTTSFWDCGEFITCSYILGVPHPPGAPLYILVGRIFSMLPTAEDIGLRVNLMSPIISAFTAMLTYLIVIRLIILWKGQPRNWVDHLALYASGVIGALAFAFSDSQWFNSVEAEVYAGSMFFTAIVVWLILKWMDHADSEKAQRYILLIFYLVGLAIGVHLLNILALPTIFLIIFLRRFEIKSPWLLIGTGVLALLEIGLAFGLYNAFAATNKIAGVAIGAVTFVGLMYMHYSFMNSPSAAERTRQFSVTALFTIVAMLALGVIYPGVVKGIPALIEKFGFVALWLVVAAVVFATFMAIKERKVLAAIPLMAVVLVMLGYSTYTALYIRSKLDPAVDENNPDTPARLVSYLNREQYGDWSITERRASVWEYQIKKMYIRYFGWQFIGKGTTLDKEDRIAETISLRGLLALPFFVGVIGMLHHFQRDWRRALAILLLFMMTGLMIVIYLNQEDPQPRERDYAYTGSFFAFALWIGIGVTAVIDAVRQTFAATIKSAASGRKDNAQAGETSLSKLNPAYSSAMLALCGLIFVAVPVNMFRFNYHTHSRTGNFVAYDYSYNILQSCEPNAIIFTNGDNDTFPLWFLQYVYNIRRDVRVVNLSLLNTNWYIKQLRDDEPRVLINLTDAQIDALQARPWKKQKISISVPKSTYDQFFSDAARLDSTLVAEENPTVRIEVEPTLYGQGIRVQDLMILKILEDNQFRKPVYFAVTVSPENKLNLDPYMRMDGLAFRILPVKVNRRFVDPVIMWKNLNEKFKYRNLNNPEIYYDENTVSLLGNYRSAFLTLAQFIMQQQDKAKFIQTLGGESHAMEWRDPKDMALRVLDRMSEAVPESVIPTNDFRLNFAIGQMYEQLGRPEEFDKRLKMILADESFDLSLRERLQFADYIESYRNQPAMAESLVQSLIAENPRAGESYLWLGRFYARRQQYNRGIEILQRWLTRKPDDKPAQAQLKQLQTLAAADSVIKADTTKNSPNDTTGRK